MAECFLGGAGSLNVKVGSISLSASCDKPVDLGGKPKVVFVSYDGTKCANFGTDSFRVIVTSQDDASIDIKDTGFIAYSRNAVTLNYVAIM